MSINNSKSQIRLPILLALALAAGTFIGARMFSGHETGSGLNKSMVKFREVLNYIDRNYVDEVETEELVDVAIRDMLEQLDPHSVYIPAEELEYNMAELEGNFEGIGIEYSIFRDTIFVVTPLSGGPSEEVGLQAGDKIIKVDDEMVAGIGITNRGVLDRLRGNKGTEVIVSIARKGSDELMDFKIIRDKIPQFSVDVSYMVDDEIGYIKVNRFTATTYDEFLIALNSLLHDGMTKLILDLTGNPGGYMDKAIRMADELLAGDPMIVFTRGKEYRYDQEYRAEREGKFESGALIVLIDEGSASASEIVSGAVQDNDRGLIVGRRSFGKGLVQMQMDLSDGSQLRLTTSRYYIPSGRSIQKDYENGIDDYYHDIYERFESGEMYSAENLAVNDSLAYKTANGRTVYGGGGITPDFYVPLDTAGGSRYLNRLFNTNSIREFALNYSDTNREKLEQMGFDAYFNDFEVTDRMLDELVDLAKSNDLKFNRQQYEHSKDLIKTYVKAQIARGIWDNEGFYPIFNQTSEIYRQALTLFDEAAMITEKNK